MILGTLEILAEAFTLSEKAGIGAPQLYDLIKDMFPAPPCASSRFHPELFVCTELLFVSHRFINYGAKMVNDQFDGTKGFAIEGGLKDANHIRNLVTELNAPMPVVVSLRSSCLDNAVLKHVRSGHRASAHLDRSSGARCDEAPW